MPARDGVPPTTRRARGSIPSTAAGPISASRLATFARCGFQYLLQHVLRLEPALEPEERKRLDPLERGSALPRRGGALPARAARPRASCPCATTPETRRAPAGAWPTRRLDALVAGSPPRFTVLWERERARFHEGAADAGWRARRRPRARSTPAHFEVGFGLARERADGRAALARAARRSTSATAARCASRARSTASTAGRTARSSCATTRRAARPRDDGGLFRGGKQLQIPFYVLAAARIFPEPPVVGGLPRLRGRRPPGRASTPRPCTGETFRALLRGLVDAIAAGALRAGAHRLRLVRLHGGVRARSRCSSGGASYKIGDPRVQRVLRLRDVAMSARSVPSTRTPASGRARDHGTSLVLEAGAGTGKTTLLIDRIEALLRSGHGAPRPDRGRHLHRERRHHHEAAPARAAGAGARSTRRRAAAERAARGARPWRSWSARRSRPSTPSARPSSASGRWSAACVPGFRIADEAEPTCSSPRPGTSG